MIRLRSFGAAPAPRLALGRPEQRRGTAGQTRRRASSLALRATADRASFGPSTGSGPSRATSRDGEAGRVGSRVRRGIRRAVTTTAAVAAVMIGTESTALACPVCFGAEETSLIHATKLGVLVMLVITFAVQGGFVGFFLYLRRRAKRNADVDLDLEWLDLQRGSKTS